MSSDGVCVICQQYHSIVQDHHVQPQAYGGKDGPTVPLCGGCHNGIHAEAVSQMSKAPRKKVYFIGETAERAKFYISEIIKSKLRAEAQGIRTAKKKLTIELDDAIMAALDRFKLDSGYTNRQKFVENIIIQLVKNR